MAVDADRSLAGWREVMVPKSWRPFSVISTTPELTGSASFARELVNELQMAGAEAQLASEPSQGRISILNSLGTVWPYKAPPWAVIVHESAWWLSCRPSMLEFLGSSRYVFCVDPGASKLLEAALGRPCLVAPMRTELFELRNHADLELRILGVGTISLTKGSDVWLEVVDRVRCGRTVAAAWVGSIPETRFAAEFLADVSRRRLEEVVQWIGPSTSMPEWYRWADVLLVTSRSESHCLVLDEARMAGLPALLFECAFSADRSSEDGVTSLSRFGGDPMVQALMGIRCSHADSGRLVQLDIKALAHHLLAVEGGNADRSEAW